MRHFVSRLLCWGRGKSEGERRVKLKCDICARDFETKDGQTVRRSDERRALSRIPGGGYRLRLTALSGVACGDDPVIIGAKAPRAARGQADKRSDIGDIKKYVREAHTCKSRRPLAVSRRPPRKPSAPRRLRRHKKSRAALRLAMHYALSPLHSSLDFYIYEFIYSTPLS